MVSFMRRAGVAVGGSGAGIGTKAGTASLRKRKAHWGLTQSQAHTPRFAVGGQSTAFVTTIMALHWSNFWMAAFHLRWADGK